MVKWTDTDLEGIDRLTRTKMREFRIHHPHASLERCYLPRSLGGRGLVNMKALYIRMCNNMRQYFYKKAEQDPFYDAFVRNDKYTLLLLKNKEHQMGIAKTREELIEEWSQKQLHGRYINILRRPHIDWRSSCQWLERGLLFPETEGFIQAIQDQVVSTLNYKKYIIKDPRVVNDVCRMCKTKSENIEHLISSCPILASREYTERHNAVAKILHCWLAWKIGYLKERTPYYKYNPERVSETPDYKLYWDRTILTDHTIPNNRPDIVLWNKDKRECLLIDIAIPAPNNIEQKYQEKITKYLPLAAEIRQVWNASGVRVLPIILGATGEIPKSLLDNLKALDVPTNMYIEMQKAVVLSACNMVRKTLNIQGDE